MRFALTILGSASATPTHGRNPTAQVLHVHDQNYLIDCGEGAQMRMLDYRIRRGNLNHIFISHLHGDHYFGLFGLLNSFALGGRREPLHLYCPVGLRPLLEAVWNALGSYESPYPLYYHEITNTETSYRLLETEHVTVDTIPLRHGVPCTGFLFREQPALRTVLKEQIDAHGIEGKAILGIKRGGDHITPDGTTIPNAVLTIAPPPARSYAFCSDTEPAPANSVQLAGVDLMYHEATFLASDTTRARETNHSTAAEAAEIASAANVGQLLIGHFSARYKNLDGHLAEAQAIFPRTALALEGMVFEVERKSNI